jgi:hypothetical protein
MRCLHTCWRTCASHATRRAPRSAAFPLLTLPRLVYSVLCTALIYYETSPCWSMHEIIRFQFSRFVAVVPEARTAGESMYKCVTEAKQPESSMYAVIIMTSRVQEVIATTHVPGAHCVDATSQHRRADTARHISIGCAEW